MTSAVSEPPVASGLYPEPQRTSRHRLGVLDGWRALSIIAVIAGHWLPLDRLVPGANSAVPAAGMAMFFTLSGFLITWFLADRPQVTPFLIRRLLRILPLAWLAATILYLAQWSDPGAATKLLANLLFTANLPPDHLFKGGEHLWSLGVEMQFYMGVALLVAIGGRRGLYLLPLMALAVTAARVAAGEVTSIVTWHRVDEILAGATVALIYLGWLGDAPRRWLARYNLLLAALVAAACCYFLNTPLAYARPYAVAALIGTTLFGAPRWFEQVMTSRPAVYIAETSYALYIFHGMLGATWLGSGELVEKYLKRPLLLAATVAFAHLSTFYYEAYFIRLAKRLTARSPVPAPPSAGQAAKAGS